MYEFWGLEKKKIKEPKKLHKCKCGVLYKGTGKMCKPCKAEQMYGTRIFE